MYKLHRECYNSNTFNGYKDSPYWYIVSQGYKIGLQDNGDWWCIDNKYKNNNHILILEQVIKECKLNINLKK